MRNIAAIRRQHRGHRANLYFSFFISLFSFLLSLLLPLLRPLLRPLHLSTPLSIWRGAGGEAFFLLLLFTSCQKDLCYHHPHDSADENHGRLNVVFDWSATQHPTASEMHLVTFLGGRSPVTYPLAGMNGGDVTLWGGTYWFVAYNSDTETTQTRGTCYDDYEVCGVPRDLSRFITAFRAQAESFTRFGACRSDGTRTTRSDDNRSPSDSIPFDDDLKYIWEPERVWVSTAQDYPVVPNTEQTLTMPMWAATYQYTFLIRNVSNLDRVASISATLDGLAECYRPSAHGPLNYTVAEIFSFHKVDASSIRGTLRVFGHSPEENTALPADLTNQLMLYVTMDNGTRYGFAYDVTEDMQHPSSSSIDEQTGEVVINIRIDDIPIPDQPTSTGLFDIDIGDFITEEWDVFPS